MAQFSPKQSNVCIPLQHRALVKPCLVPNSESQLQENFASQGYPIAAKALRVGKLGRQNVIAVGIHNLKLGRA